MRGHSAPQSYVRNAALAAAFFAFVLLCAITGANAQQDASSYPIGKVVALEGHASYIGKDSKTEIKQGDPVYLGSTVHTDAASKILIMFIDNTQITLTENSELLIDEYIFDPYDAKENEAKFSVLEGGFKWVSGLLSKRERPKVKIVTPEGSIGIRGTEFWAGPVGEDKEDYGIVVTEGLVFFAGDWGSVDIPEGTGVIITHKKQDGGDKKAEGPKNATPWSDEQTNTALATVTFSNMGDVNNALTLQKKDNVRAALDYRGRMFPYKPDPNQIIIKDKDGKFFTDEFEKMRNKK